MKAFTEFDSHLGVHLWYLSSESLTLNHRMCGQEARHVDGCEAACRKSVG
jgi:hypothetical protein